MKTTAFIMSASQRDVTLMRSNQDENLVEKCKSPPGGGDERRN
jgi:hypothetical protein